MTKKILKDKNFGYSRGYGSLHGNMEEVLSQLNALLNEAKAAGYSNIQMKWDSGYSSDDVEWNIVGDRLETDKEYATRLAIEKRIAKQNKDDRILREQKERKEYERLKKKFENKV